MRKILSKLIALHRYVGLAICVFLVHLSITGIFLNHSIGLNLDQTFISWPWVLKQYNLKVPEPEQVFTIEANNFSRFGEEVFFNDKPILFIENDLMGAIKLGNQYIIATNSDLYLMNDQGFIVDENNALPFTIKKLGTDNKNIFIQEQRGINWQANTIESEWNKTEDFSGVWSLEGTLTKINEQKISKFFVGEGVSLEQIILDFHSGAVFQRAGKLFFDAVSILLIILSFSGIWLWYIKKR